MKTLLTLAMAILVTTFTAKAGPPFTPNWTPIQPRTLAAAEACHKGGEAVALVCKDCKSVNEAPKKGLAAFFKADSTHGCSGCGGKITVKNAMSGKGLTTGEYTHVCSKCSKDSTTCSKHAK